jgi:glutamine synthetase
LQIAEIKREIKEKHLSLLGVTYVDLAGVSRMKPANARNLDLIIKNGIKTSVANLALTAYDHLVRESSLDISQGDYAIVPDPDTFVVPSYIDGIGKFIGNIHEKDGSFSQICPRSFYSKMLERALSAGFQFEVGFEAEFHLVRREGNSIIPADYTITHNQDGFNFHSKFIADAVRAVESVRIDLEKAHIEGGHGQLEFDIAHQNGGKAADEIVYFKDAIKTVARSHGYIASFMPKIGHDWWGSGLHLHMSLWNGASTMTSRNLFADEGGKSGLSKLAYNFIAGVLEHLPALTAVACPSFNSYKRLLQGKWNSDAQVYAFGGRGGAIRVPDERGKATRLECRFPDASCNPYLALGCILACGLEGIEKNMMPPSPLTFDLSFLSDREIKERGFALMPRSLREAVAAFEKDALVKNVMGNLLFEEYIKNREHDISQGADKVTQWEVDRFLDIY